MARVAKTPQYEAFNRSPNCFGRHQRHGLSLREWLRPERPLMLEVGAGSAAISQAFGRENPEWQVLALDRKSDRLYKAARQSQESNLAFLQADLDNLAEYADLENKISLLWLAFPDPQPGRRREKHRLTHPARIGFYLLLLAPEGIIRFKTDNAEFFAYSHRTLAAREELEIGLVVEDLAAAGYDKQPVDVQTVTRYEKRFLEAGLPIHYLEVRRC